jgi:hypothetical protein
MKGLRAPSSLSMAESRKVWPLIVTLPPSGSSMKNPSASSGTVASVRGDRLRTPREAVCGPVAD